VYGTPEPELMYFNYCGVIPSDILPEKIEGNFGLVWGDHYDLNESDSYFKYNNPHRASLYVASGLPLIAWDKSPIADLISKYKIGIAVDSLDHIEKYLNSLSDEEYKSMKINVLALRQDVIRGNFLIHVLDHILNDLNSP